MNDPLPLVGWPLHMAIFDLVTEPMRETAQRVGALESYPSRAPEMAGRRVLWLDICGQLMTGKLVAKGFLSRPVVLADAVSVQRIEPQFFSGAVADYDRNILTMSNGVAFVDVRIFKPDQLPPLAEVLSPKNKGGRNPTYDWVAFNQEVVRLALTPDGFQTRAALRRHMTEWCARSWDRQPSQATLAEQVSKCCPPEISER